jgi:hypothetical protein
MCNMPTCREQDPRECYGCVHRTPTVPPKAAAINDRYTIIKLNTSPNRNDYLGERPC